MQQIRLLFLFLQCANSLNRGSSRSDVSYDHKTLPNLVDQSPTNWKTICEMVAGQGNNTTIVKPITGEGEAEMGAFSPTSHGVFMTRRIVKLAN